MRLEELDIERPTLFFHTLLTTCDLELLKSAVATAGNSLAVSKSWPFSRILGTMYQNECSTTRIQNNFCKVNDTCHQEHAIRLPAFRSKKTHVCQGL